MAWPQEDSVDALAALLDAHGTRVDAAADETWALYTGYDGSGDLGMADGDADAYDLELPGRTVTLAQSPGLLGAAPDNTGAVVWRAAVSMAQWLAARDCWLFDGLLSKETTVVELGAGVGALAAAAGPRVRRWLATDRPYVMRLLRRNAAAAAAAGGAFEAAVLDWDASDAASWAQALGLGNGLVLVAVDVLYSPAGVASFLGIVEQLRRSGNGDAGLSGTGSGSGSASAVRLLLVAGQLRDAGVFEAWLAGLLGEGEGEKTGGARPARPAWCVWRVEAPLAEAEAAAEARPRRPGKGKSKGRPGLGPGSGPGTQPSRRGLVVHACIPV